MFLKFTFFLISFVSIANPIMGMEYTKDEIELFEEYERYSKLLEAIGEPPVELQVYESSGRPGRFLNVGSSSQGQNEEFTRQQAALNSAYTRVLRALRKPATDCITLQQFKDAVKSFADDETVTAMGNYFYTNKAWRKDIGLNDFKQLVNNICSAKKKDVVEAANLICGE